LGVVVAVAGRSTAASADGPGPRLCPGRTTTSETESAISFLAGSCSLGAASALIGMRVSCPNNYPWRLPISQPPIYDRCFRQNEYSMASSDTVSEGILQY
ncbi:hypothetical protein CLOM_g24320, partial [Closterium sp. NIES-68]